MDKLKIFASDIDIKTMQQIEDINNSEVSKNSIIRIMPDTHYGCGCPIGFTMKIPDDTPICPNLIGTDIGCGVRTSIYKDVDTSNWDWKKIDEEIRKTIPMGFNIHKEPLSCVSDFEFNTTFAKSDRFLRSLGTLGGGNHFIEFAKSDNGYFAITIHTGSRSLGADVNKYYQELAIKGCLSLKKPKDEIVAILKKYGLERSINNVLKQIQPKPIKKELAYLKEDVFNLGYLSNVEVAQGYAKINRTTLCTLLEDAIKNVTGQKITEFTFIDTPHNYIENDTIFKGAVYAPKGRMITIPINMRDGSLICKGKGNKDWNCAAPHGAGRLKSRNQAKQELSMAEFEDTMRGINTFSITENTLDESPMAYRDIEYIKKAIEPTVEIIDRLRPIYNVKCID